MTGVVRVTTRDPLVRVTRRNPCPVCERKKWCSVSADGGIAICTKVASDKPTKDGNAWIHKLTESARWRPLQPRTTQCEKPAFGLRDAEFVWRVALARARDDNRIDEDREVYDYLAKRKLADAWEQGAFGVLPTGDNLPASVNWWPRTGHRLIVPLFDERGELALVQSRCVRPSNRKTLNPTGGSTIGRVFANQAARAMLATGTTDS